MINSKEGAKTVVRSAQDRGVLVVVVVTCAVFSAIILASAVHLPAPLSGRLHPALVPTALAVLVLASAAAVAAAVATRGRRAPVLHEAASHAPTSFRSIASALLSLAILALGVRAAGLVPSVIAAGTVAALGVSGVGVVRALAIGAGLSVVTALIFVVALRQPLPLWPAHSAFGF